LETAKTLCESEMALFPECMPQYAQKVLDTADIVRDAIYHQLTVLGGLIANETVWFALDDLKRQLG